MEYRRHLLNYSDILFIVVILGGHLMNICCISCWLEAVVPKA